MKAKILNCSHFELPKNHNRKGNLTALHNLRDVPFNVQRIFYLYDIPGGTGRGAHAHKKCHQFIIAASGSFDVLLDDGNIRKVVSLNQPYIGLHIPPGIWASEINFSSGAVCLVLASELYEEDDYLRDYNEFLKFNEVIHGS